MVEKEISIDSAIASTKTCQLVKAVGEKVTLQAFTGAIIMSTEFFNTGVQMTESQAIQTASLLIEQYPYETFEDLILCLKNAKMGRYGKIYRVDGQTIFEWFKLYLDEKYERFEQIKHNEKISNLEGLSDTILPFADAILDASKKAGSSNAKPVKVLTDKIHFEKFKELVQTSLTKEELVELRKSYELENRKHLFMKFDQYIEVIDRKLQSL